MRPQGLEGSERLLVIIVARIGDTLLVTPALRALRAAIPRGRLDVLAHPKRVEVLRALPFIDRLGTITPRRAWYRGRWHRKSWDVALVYGKDGPLVRYAARVAGRVIAFDQGDAALNAALWRAVATLPAPMHAVHERLLLPGALGIRAADLRLAYAPTAEELARARQWLGAQAGSARPLVGLQVKSFPAKHYRDWPLASFAELGRRILARHPQARIIVFGDKESRESAAALVRALGTSIVPAAGTLALRETAAIMSLLDLYVGVDTGPTHIAGALGVPMVALYHCYHRGRDLGPLQHDKLEIVEHPASDADCRRHAPMADIAIDEVWAAVTSLLRPGEWSKDGAHRAA
jgi:heptosyltransferase III